VIRCGLYARVSTEDQANVKDGSLDTQLDKLQREVRHKNANDDDDWRVAAVYREEGRSGKDTNRPQYQSMLADVRAGKLDAVLCTRMDRVSRSILDFFSLLEVLKEHQVAFISLQENWDTSTPMGEFAMGQIMLVAQLERRQISQRTQEKAFWRAQRGLSNGGQILGYDLDPDNPGIRMVNPQERDLVVLIYKTYVKEKGTLRTAQEINRKGYRTKSYTSRRGAIHVGKEFADTAILRILTNSYFIGKIRYGEEVYEGKHEPIVPNALWEQAQRILAGNRGARGRPQNGHLFVLEGLVRCGECGAYMTPYYGNGRGGKTYYYYACTSRNHRGSEACSMSNVPAQPLEQVIAARLAQLGKADRMIERLVAEAMADTSELLGNLEQRRETLMAHRRKVGDQIDALVESIAGRRTALKPVTQKILELDQQKDQLDNEVLDLDLDIETIKKKAVSAGSLSESLTTFSDLYQEALPEERRELVRLRVNQLIWTPEEIRLALLDHPAPEGEVAMVQREATIGSGGGTRTPDTWIMIPLL
jgi:site-specific DNA recombinase